MNTVAFLCRGAFAPVWLFVFGIVAMFQLPMTAATTLVLFVVGLVPPLIMLLRSNGPSPTIAEVLYQVEVSRTER